MKFSKRQQWTLWVVGRDVHGPKIFGPLRPGRNFEAISRPAATLARPVPQSCNNGPDKQRLFKVVYEAFLPSAVRSIL